MSELKKEVQIFIVQQLARYKSVKEIQEAVKENFDGVILDRQQVYYYDGQMKKTENVAAKTKELQQIFLDTREKFKTNVLDIPIALQARRIEVCNTILISELAKTPILRNDKKIMELFKYVAEELGGAYTNKTEITGANGQPLMPEDMASIVYQDLVNKAKWSPVEAAQWVADNYRVDTSKLKINA